MKILIGTPTYNHQVMAPFMSSVLALTEGLRVAGHTVEWLPVQSTLIHVARNAIASKALLDGEVSHLLFIDGDVNFRPQAVLRMLAFDRPVVACAYPNRNLNLAAFHAAAQRTADPMEAASQALNYPVWPIPGSSLQQGFVPTKTAPAGLTLIQRGALETLRDRYPELYGEVAGSGYEPFGLSHILRCYDPLQEPNSHAVGEDVAFCRRWIAAGGEIWTLVDERVGHTGPYTFAGQALAKMKAPGPNPA